MSRIAISGECVQLYMGMAQTECQWLCRATLCAGHMQLDKAWLLDPSSSDKCEALNVWHILSTDPEDSYFTTSHFRASALRTVLAVTRSQMGALSSSAPSALPAAMRPLQAAVAAAEQHGGLKGTLQAAAQQLLADIDKEVARCTAARKPLVCPALMKRTPLKLLNPRFEADFSKWKDYDPDRERAEYQEYKRMAAKEQRGAFCLA
jgi:Nop14-like family